MVTFNLQVLMENGNSLASQAPASVYTEPHGCPYAKQAWPTKENKLQRNCYTSSSIYLAVRSQYRLCLRLIKKINESIFPLARSMGIQVELNTVNVYCRHKRFLRDLFLSSCFNLQNLGDARIIFAKRIPLVNNNHIQNSHKMKIHEDRGNIIKEWHVVQENSLVGKGIYIQAWLQ